MPVRVSAVGFACKLKLARPLFDCVPLVTTEIHGVPVLAVHTQPVSVVTPTTPGPAPKP